MNQKLYHLEKEFLKLYAEFHPTSATSLGLPDQNGRYGDYSSPAVQYYLKALDEFHGRLEKFQSKTPLDSEDQIDLQLLQNKILLEIQELIVSKPHIRNPSFYIQEILYGLWMLLVRPFPKREKLNCFLSRLQKIPNFFSQAKSLLENPPKIWTRIALEELEGLVLFLKDSQKDFLKNYPKSKAQILHSFSKVFFEIENFRKFLKKQLLKISKGRFAIGEKDFNFLLKYQHGFSEQSKEVLKIGKKVFEETKLALKAQAFKMDKKKSWQKLIEEIRDHHPSRKNLLKTYQRETDRIKKFISQKRLVKIPPKEKLKIIETPSFARSTVPFAAYIDPPLFGTDRTGTFFVTPSRGSSPKEIQEYLKEHCHASLIITALHEGYPGHHLQFVYQANLKRPIRKIFNTSSYYEGWALYCEEMMGENGFYSPEVKLLQLKDKLWRACRIIIDVGIQTGSMSDNKAVRFLAKEAKMSKAAARADINWYSQSPTVPQSYLTGCLKIKALREKAKLKWGKDFSLKKFHEWFLGFGAIPISMIEKNLPSKI